MQTIDIAQIEISLEKMAKISRDLRENIHVTHAINQMIKKTNYIDNGGDLKALHDRNQKIAIDYSALRQETRILNELINPKQE